MDKLRLELLPMGEGLVTFWKSMFYSYILGARNKENAQLLYELFHRDHFRISITNDAATVEVCGAIKVTLVTT